MVFPRCWTLSTSPETPGRSTAETDLWTHIDTKLVLSGRIGHWGRFSDEELRFIVLLVKFYSLLLLLVWSIVVSAPLPPDAPWRTCRGRGRGSSGGWRASRTPGPGPAPAWTPPRSWWSPPRQTPRCNQTLCSDPAGHIAHLQRKLFYNRVWNKVEWFEYSRVVLAAQVWTGIPY